MLFRSGEQYFAPTLEAIKEAAIRQLDFAVADKGEFVAVREARGQLAKYFHSFRGSAELRAKINRAQTREDVIEAISAL